MITLEVRALYIQGALNATETQNDPHKPWRKLTLAQVKHYHLLVFIPHQTNFEGSTFCIMLFDY